MLAICQGTQVGVIELVVTYIAAIINFNTLILYFFVTWAKVWELSWKMNQESKILLIRFESLNPKMKKLSFLSTDSNSWIRKQLFLIHWLETMEKPLYQFGIMNQQLVNLCICTNLYLCLINFKNWLNPLAGDVINLSRLRFPLRFLDTWRS